MALRSRTSRLRSMDSFRTNENMPPQSFLTRCNWKPVQMPTGTSHCSFARRRLSSGNSSPVRATALRNSGSFGRSRRACSSTWDRTRCPRAVRLADWSRMSLARSRVSAGRSTLGTRKPNAAHFRTSKFALRKAQHPRNSERISSTDWSQVGMKCVRNSTPASGSSFQPSSSARVKCENETSISRGKVAIKLSSCTR